MNEHSSCTRTNGTSRVRRIRDLFNWTLVMDPRTIHCFWKLASVLTIQRNKWATSSLSPPTAKNEELVKVSKNLNLPHVMTLQTAKLVNSAVSRRLKLQTSAVWNACYLISEISFQHFRHVQSVVLLLRINLKVKLIRTKSPLNNRQTLKFQVPEK